MYHILVYGFYGKENLGDDLFQEAFRTIFPELTFTFTDHLTRAQVLASDAVFFGGGSMLDGALSIEGGAWPVLLEKPIFYIGVGAETDIHKDHWELLGRAHLVAVRSSMGTDKLAGLPVITIPDLVYSLAGPSEEREPESVLVVPNIAVVPDGRDPYWKHSAWEFFRSEFSQFLDELIDQNFRITFLSMCRNEYLPDVGATFEILNRMRHRRTSMISDEIPKTAAEAISFFSRFSVVVTQRFHGIVLADLAGTACVPIQHHDKLKSRTGVSYYGATKGALLDALERAAPVAVETDFALLKRLVIEELQRCS
jgi:polysaccharide pyruvyl transferase WcaK-like protein